jgi:hypothetical protein
MREKYRPETLVNNQKMALFKHSENISIAVED